MPESIDRAELTAFTQRAGDGPVVMLNLLKFRADGGAARYAQYGIAVAPLLERVGGRPVFAANPAEGLISGEDWDLMILVEYPTRQAFLDMVGSPEYAAIAHLREESLERSRLQATDPMTLPDA